MSVVVSKPYDFWLPPSQITIFDADSEEHQDLDLAILTALLKGEWPTKFTVPPPFPFSHSREFCAFHHLDIFEENIGLFFLLFRHKLISVRTIKPGNGLGQSGHRQETYPNLWTTLEGIMKMKFLFFWKDILHIGLFKRDKEKIGGEIGIAVMARHPGKQRHVSFLVCLLKNKVSLASWKMK